MRKIIYEFYCRGCSRKITLRLFPGDLETELFRHTCPSGHAFLRDGMQARAADFWQILTVDGREPLDTKVSDHDTIGTQRKEIEWQEQRS
jgi:hypothetical protein